MKYRELLLLYKEGKLDAEMVKEIEETLEKSDAILDYLSGTLDTPWSDAATERQSDSAAGSLQERQSDSAAGSPKERQSDPADVDRLNYLPETDPLEEKFKHSLQRSIRRAFIRLGVAVGVVVLVCLLLVEFALPHVVDQFFYDPAETVARAENDGYEISTNRMSLDMAVYTELLLPERIRDNVYASRRGYGCYDIIINQNIAYTGYPMTDVSGRIERDRLTLYDTNTLKQPPTNAFEWGTNYRDGSQSLTEQVRKPEENEDGSTSIYNMSAGGTPEDSLANIQELDEKKLYTAYVTLDRVTPYEELLEYLEAHELGRVWCAVQTGDYVGGNWGFSTGGGSGTIAWDNERYPLLCLDGLYTSWEEQQAVMKTEAGAAQHFKSMINYLSDQTTFCQMMNLESISRQSASETAAYVDEYGLNIYGFAVAGEKEKLEELMETDEVYSIYVESMR